jgi:hypothetical protein
LSAIIGQEIPLVVGMLGWSAQAISKGKSGKVWFPVGKIDPSFIGGRKWVKLRVTALEDVREKRDIIVADEELNVKEHTPVELSYQTTAGPFQRVTETTPLPVTPKNDTATYITITVTAQGATPLVTPSVATKKIRVRYFCYSNAGVLQSDCSLTFDQTGAVGNLRHRAALAPNGGVVNANLIYAWEGADGQTLYAFLQAANANGVHVTIGYTEED